MAQPIGTLVQDFGWTHTGVGLTGNILAFADSVALLPGLGKLRRSGGAETAWRRAGAWLFLFGALFRMIGSLGASREDPRGTAAERTGPGIGARGAQPTLRAPRARSRSEAGGPAGPIARAGTRRTDDGPPQTLP